MSNNEPIRVAQIMGKMVGGGVESFVMNYYRNIDKNKIQFDFIIDDDSTHIPRDEIESLGGKIIEVPPYQHMLTYIKTMTKVFIENKYQIVHSNINTLSVFPLFCAKRAGIPVRIAHSHSTTNKKEWNKNLIKNILRPFSRIFATDYFACSEYAGRWLFGNKAFDKGKVTIVRNAIETEKFKYNEDIRDKVRKILGLKGKYVLGHVGRFVAQKNHAFLIDVFNEVYKENKNVILLLIGQGPLENEIKEKVSDLGISNEVKFLEQRDDVNELMQAMDCFIFPSLYEGLGIVTIEAQCSGLKCLCSNNIPKEAKVTDLLEYCSLKDKSVWKEKILTQKKNTRKDFSNEICENGYKIEKETNKLERKYFDLNKKVKI